MRPSQGPSEDHIDPTSLQDHVNCRSVAKREAGTPCWPPQEAAKVLLRHCPKRQLHIIRSSNTITALTTARRQNKRGCAMNISYFRQFLRPDIINGSRNPCPTVKTCNQILVSDAHTSDTFYKDKDIWYLYCPELRWVRILKHIFIWIANFTQPYIHSWCITKIWIAGCNR